MLTMLSFWRICIECWVKWKEQRGKSFFLKLGSNSHSKRKGQFRTCVDAYVIPVSCCTFPRLEELSYAIPAEYVFDWRLCNVHGQCFKSPFHFFSLDQCTILHKTELIPSIESSSFNSAFWLKGSIPLATQYRGKADFTIIINIISGDRNLCFSFLLKPWIYKVK